MGLMTEHVRERVAKLPIWAKHLIEQIDNELTHTQRALSAYNTDAPPTNTTAYPKDIPASLGDNALVRFRFDGGYVDVRIIGDELSVRTDMGTQLVAAPRAHNILRIRAEQRKRSSVSGS